MLIAIGTAGWIRSQEHFLVSAHPSVRTMVAGGKVLASAECDGIYRFTFNDGRIVERKLMGPRSVKLQRWSLELNEWLPGKRIHEVRVVRHTRRLGQPQPWSSFPDLANASGLGTYRASFYLPPATSAATELILRVAEVGDTFRVRVNGRALPPVDQVRREVDIRPWAKAGRNAIEIEVASTLRNRMRQLYKEQEGRAAERNGLGPGLSLKLYSIAEINR